MESAAKRKAAVAAASELESRPSKRQKLPQSDNDANATGETAASTTEKGLKFLESLKNAKDKTGRSIATHFLKLPDKSLKDYYDVIKLPISIESMEARLNRGDYPNLAQLESDCKRLVNNAKAYNDKKSIIYEDAERLRKTASNWMTKNNPAYRDSGYQAVATPVPGEEPVPFGRPQPRPATTPKSAIATPDTTERSRRSAAAQQTSTPAPSKLKRSAVQDKAKDSDAPQFDSKSYQQAQERIVRELIDYQDPESGLQIFLPFVNLPSRSLKDYYQLIKRPMSLSAVQKKVNGVIGREPPTGATTLKSWDDFEREMELIWLNARDYNEDGSDIYNLSIELEELFKERLDTARAKVAEPPQPKLKLNMSAAPKQQLKLKLRQSPGSEVQTPDSRGSATPGIVIDREALLRQQRHVQDGVNGTRGSRPSSSGKAQTPAATNPFSGPRGGSAAVAPVATAGINGVKTDVQSPALSSIRAASTASDGQRLSLPIQTPVMAPPRPASGSPHPSGGPVGQPSAYPQYQPPVPHYVPPPVSHFEHFRKVPLKSLDEALIPKITLSTNPALSLPKPYTIEIPADKRKTNYSVTINLPPTHHWLNIVPYVPVALTSRLYRVFVHVNGGKAYERHASSTSTTTSTSGALNGAGGAVNGTGGVAGGAGGGMKKGEPLYEAKLVGGVNRIEIEAIAESAAAGKAARTGDVKEQVDVEKATIFVNVLRG